MRRSLLAFALISLIACTSTGAGTSDAGRSDADRSDEGKPEPVEATAPPPADEGVEPPPAGELYPEDGAPPPGVKTKGNLPVRTETELAAEAEARDECVAECVKSRQAEAKGADAIEAECQTECLAKLPIEQVEVVPDSFAPPQPE